MGPYVGMFQRLPYQHLLEGEEFEVIDELSYEELFGVAVEYDPESGEFYE